MSVIQQNNTDKMRIPSHILQRADQLHLALHWNSESIMAAIFDMKTKQPLWLQYQVIQPWECMQSLQSWQWHQPLYRKVTLTHCPQHWTLCPSHLFEEEKAHVWFPPNDKLTLAHASIKGQNIVLIEQYDKTGAAFNQLFSHIKESSIVEMWLHFHLSQHPQKDHLTLIVENDLIGVIAQKQGDLILANQFAGNQAEDVLYFASAVLQQNQLSQDTPITLAGKNALPSLLEYFAPYFIHVQLWNPPLGLQLPKNHVPNEWHSILLHTLCAS